MAEMLKYMENEEQAFDEGIEEAASEATDNNHCLARYDGKLCTAIFNPFSGYYYVDDVYGVLEESEKE